MNRFQFRIFAMVLMLIYEHGFTAIKGPSYYSLRSMGMGNTTITNFSEKTSIFHNPAGLCLLSDTIVISFSPVVLSAHGKFITLAKAIEKHKSKLSNISQIEKNFIDMVNNLDGQWMGVAYSPEISVATRNIGFGVYSVLPVNVRIESGHFIPKLALRGQRDLVFSWAVGIPLKNTNNNCGMSIEYIQRSPLSETITTYSETFIYFNKIASSKAIGVIGELSDVKHGVSFDIGFIHDFTSMKGFRVSYDIKDLLGVIGGKLVFPPMINTACSYYLPFFKKFDFIETVLVALEFSDLFGVEPQSQKYEHFAKKIHFGTELDMNFVALRFGLNQGYFTAGAGLNFGIFAMDYAFFTEELGYYPGQFPNRKQILSMGVELRVANTTRTNAMVPKQEDRHVPTIQELQPEATHIPDTGLPLLQPIHNNDTAGTQRGTVEQPPFNRDSLLTIEKKDLELYEKKQVDLGVNSSQEVNEHHELDFDTLEQDSVISDEEKSKIMHNNEESIGWE